MEVSWRFCGAIVGMDMPSDIPSTYSSHRHNSELNQRIGN
jgi:hypothetical protein